MEGRESSLPLSPPSEDGPSRVQHQSLCSLQLSQCHCYRADQRKEASSRWKEKSPRPSAGSPAIETFIQASTQTFSPRCSPTQPTNHWRERNNFTVHIKKSNFLCSILEKSLKQIEKNDPEWLLTDFLSLNWHLKSHTIFMSDIWLNQTEFDTFIDTITNSSNRVHWGRTFIN